MQALGSGRYRQHPWTFSCMELGNFHPTQTMVAVCCSGFHVSGTTLAAQRGVSSLDRLAIRHVCLSQRCEKAKVIFLHRARLLLGSRCRKVNPHLHPTSEQSMVVSMTWA